jgi:hypothetical protein
MGVAWMSVIRGGAKLLESYLFCFEMYMRFTMQFQLVQRSNGQLKCKKCQKHPA